MPAGPAPGEPATFQEVAPNDGATDWAETRARGLGVEGPAGAFADVAQVVESSTVEPASRGCKRYAAGTGLVREEELGATGEAVGMTVDLQPRRPPRAPSCLRGAIP